MPNNRNALAVRSRKNIVQNVKAGRIHEETSQTYLSVIKSNPFIAFTGTSLGDYIYSPGANISFELSQSSEYNSFSSLYDECRIPGVDVTITWVPLNVSTFSNATNSSGVMFYAPDRDGGAVPATLDTMLQRQSLVRIPVSFRAATTMELKNQACGYSNSEGRVVSGNNWFDLATATENITFCVGTMGMLKRATSPSTSGLNDRALVHIRPRIEFRRRR